MQLPESVGPFEYEEHPEDGWTAVAVAPIGPTIQATTTTTTTTANGVASPTRAVEANDWRSRPLQHNDVMQYPPPNTAPPSVLPQMRYDPAADGADDSRYRTVLPDYSDGWIDLDGRNPGDQRAKPTMLVEKIPDLPVWPQPFGPTNAVAYGYGSRTSKPAQQGFGGGSTGAMMEFAARFRPKRINPQWLVSSSGWFRLPHPSGVYVAHPKFGTSVALYWRYSAIPTMIGAPPSLEYAVMKLEPMPLGDADRYYLGNYWRVPARHVKPLKLAIWHFPSGGGGSMVSTSANDLVNIRFCVDTGEEWAMPIDPVRAAYRNGKDPRIRAACNAFLRDFPFMENFFAFVPTPLPPDLASLVSNWATAVAQYQDGSYRTRVVLPGAPSNYPGALASAPPAKKADDDDDDDDKKDADKKDGAAVPPTASASALIGYRVVQLEPWK